MKRYLAYISLVLIPTVAIASGFIYTDGDTVDFSGTGLDGSPLSGEVILDPDAANTCASSPAGLLCSQTDVDITPDDANNTLTWVGEDAGTFTPAGIAENASDIADHIAADNDVSEVNELGDLSITGDILQYDSDGDGNIDDTVNLSFLLGSDDQQLSRVGNSIVLEDGGAPVDLSDLISAPNLDNDSTNELGGLSIAGGSLQYDANGDGTIDDTVALPSSSADDTTQTGDITAFSVNGAGVINLGVTFDDGGTDSASLTLPAPEHRDVGSVVTGLALSDNGDTFTVNTGNVCERRYIEIDGIAHPFRATNIRTMNIVDNMNAFAANNQSSGDVAVIMDTPFTVPCAEGIVRYQVGSRGVRVTNNTGTGNARFRVRLSIIQGGSTVTSGRSTYNFPDMNDFEVSFNTGPFTWQPLAPGNYTLRATLETVNAADLSFVIDQLTITAEQFH